MSKKKPKRKYYQWVNAILILKRLRNSYITTGQLEKVDEIEELIEVLEKKEKEMLKAKQFSFEKNPMLEKINKKRKEDIKKIGDWLKKRKSKNQNG